MKVGYANTNGIEQNLDKQILKLQESGCEKIYDEMLKSVRAKRPTLKRCLDNLRAGDTLMVCRLSCLGTSVEHILQMLNELYDMNVTFVSLDDNFSTNGLTGQVLSHITEALKTVKKDVFLSRVHEGRQEAKERGIKFGRKEGSVNRRNKNKPHQCRKLYDNGLSISRIMTLLNIRSYSTVYRYLSQTGAYPNSVKEDAVKPARLSKKELQKLKKEVYDDSHQLDLF